MKSRKSIMRSSKRTAKATNQRCRLLELPTELRLTIYEYVFASLAFNGGTQELYHLTALLCMAREVFSEAGSVFLKYNDEL